jgi:glycosyltransferase involved in cell wall biosynthesis
MRKLLVLTHEFPPIGGGGASVASNLALEISKKDEFDIDVITASFGDLPRYEKINDRLRIHRVFSFRMKKDRSRILEHVFFIFFGFLKARKLVSERKYDLCHAHFIVPAGYIAWALKDHVSYILQAHGSDIPGQNKKFSLIFKLINGLWKKILSDSSAIIVPTEYLFEGLIKNISDVAAKTIILPPGYRDTVSSSSKESLILLAGRLVASKGMESAIRALSKIALDNWKIKIAGDGSSANRLRLLVDSLGLREKIEFLGWVDRTEMDRLYARASIYLAPSEKESFGLTLIEAMNGRARVIARDIPSHRFIVEKSEMGALYRTNEELEKLVSDYIGIGPVEEEKTASLKNSFSLEAAASKYCELFDEVSKKPLVSVVIPTWNRARTIKRAIDSVFSQTYPSIEIIIVDDGSTDGTSDLINTYGKKVRYVKVEHGGVSKALNIGIKMTKGEYVAFLDSDDEFYPKKIERQIRAMLQKKARVSLGGSVIKVDASKGRKKRTKKGLVHTSDIMDMKVVRGSSFIMAHKYVFADCLFDETLLSGVDLDFLLRVMKSERVLSVPDALVVTHKTFDYHRISTDPVRKIQGITKILQKNKNNDYGLEKKEREYLESISHYSLSVFYFIAGDVRTARKYINFSSQLPFRMRIKMITVYILSHFPQFQRVFLSFGKKLWRQGLSI